MKILITNESRGATGGIETYLKTLAPMLTEKGHEVGWLFGHAESYGPLISNEDAKRVWMTNPTTFETVRSEICEWQPDVIYANGLHDPRWDTWLAKRYPTAFFAHGFFGACISGRKCHSVGELQVCQLVLGPACLLHYLPKGCGGRSPIRMIRDYRRERLRQRNLKLFQAIVVASRYMAKEYQRQSIGVERLRVLPLFPTGIMPDPMQPGKRSDWTNRVLLVGRLTDLKGTSLVTEAVAIASKMLNRNLTLLVVGDGPGRVSIERDSIKYNVPTELRGWSDYTERNAAMRNSDILLVPSLWPEPFGLVGIEAGCVGLPSVAFNVGGISDWLEQGVSGELATGNPATAQSLGEALTRALASRAHHEKLCVNSWKTALRFSPKSHIEELCQIFEQIRTT